MPPARFIYNGKERQLVHASFCDDMRRRKYLLYLIHIYQYANGELLDHLYDLVYSFGIYDVTGFLDYITGIEDYFFDYDDADCATAVVIYMGAPAFEEIAGSEDLSTGEAILTYSDYIQFLERVSYDFLQI